MGSGRLQGAWSLLPTTWAQKEKQLFATQEEAQPQHQVSGTIALNFSLQSYEKMNA